MKQAPDESTPAVGQIDIAHLEASLKEFANTLGACAELLAVAKQKNSANHQRVAMYGAVGAAMQFVRSLRPLEDSELYKPLELAQNCLLDLTRGIVNPLFRLENPSNAADWETRKFKFHCAVAVQELMLAGMKRLEACA